MSVLLVARRQGIMLDQLFARGGSAAPGLRAAAAARQEDIGERDLLARGALSSPAKNGWRACPRPRGTTRQEDGFRYARGGMLEPSSTSSRRTTPAARSPAQPNAKQLAEIKKIIAGLPTCGYRRVHALIR
jgi:hypothetical protein